MLVVPNPTIVPESPLKESTLLFSLLYVGGLIKTRGCVVCEYPTPPSLVMVIDVTTPALIDAVAVALAVVPNPTGF